jgi:hypothetical protein
VTANAPDPPLVTIFLTNGTATSGGNGPGAVQVPQDEGRHLISQKLAVAGSTPPAGYPGGPLPGGARNRSG